MQPSFCAARKCTSRGITCVCTSTRSHPGGACASVRVIELLDRAYGDPKCTHPHVHHTLAHRGGRTHTYTCTLHSSQMMP